VGYWQEGSGLWFPPSLLHHPAARPVLPEEIAILDDLTGLGDFTDPTRLPMVRPGAATYPPWIRLAVLTTLLASVVALLAATHRAF
jgi:hypothetical protein